MKGAAVVGIQPELLKWARESIGKSLADVAYTLKRSLEEVESWENGNKSPTYVQLEKLAYEVYKRPLAVFFLPNPPEEKDPKSDFRTLPVDELQTLLPDTYLHIRRARVYQIALNELFGAANPSSDPIWRSVVLSRQGSVTEQASAIRAHLKVTLEDQMKWPNDDQALKHWRSSVEHAGIFVFKGAFKQKAISGFSLSGDVFPVIYLNNSTTKTRQIFSLFHELAHILLRMNGLSKFETDYIEELPQHERETEKFCNALAAEILIPIADFERHAEGISGNVEETPEEVFKNLAGRYGVSREAVLRRFLDKGKVSAAYYRNKAREWSSQQRQGKGGDYYATRSVYLSDSMAREVFSRYYWRQITKEQASEYLGIKPQNFEKLEGHMLRGVEA